VDEEGASGGEYEADAPGDIVITILILIRMMKFNFNSAFIFHSDKSFEHEELNSMMVIR
jgi:hypothetical protein